MLNQQFELVQHERAVDIYRHILTSGTQFTLIVIVADVTAIGVAMTNRQAGLLIASAAFPLAAQYILASIGRISAPIIYTAIATEDALGGPNRTGLVASFLNGIEPQLLQEYRDIRKTEDQAMQAQLARNFRVGSRLSFRTPRRILWIIAAGQLTTGVIVVGAFGWQLF